MGWIFWAAKWWLIISVLSLAIFALLITWDWFWFRQLPWLKWRATQDKTSVTANILEAAHIATREEDEGQSPDEDVALEEAERARREQGGG